MNMRKFIYLILTLGFFAMILEVSGKFFFSSDYINNKIIKKLENQNNIKVTINGQSKFSLFFDPHITISNIALSSSVDNNNLATISEAKLSINISSIFEGKIEFDQISLISGEFFVHENKNFLFMLNTESLVNNGFNNILLNDFKVSFGSNNNITKINKFNAKITATKDKINFITNFYIKNNYVTNKVIFNRADYNSDINFQTGKSFIDIKGKFLHDEKNFNGKIVSKIASVALLQDMIELISPSAKFLDNLELKKDIDLTANFDFIEGLLKVSNILFKNDEIIGNGNINIDTKNNINVDFTFEKIDYDALFTKNSNTQNNDNYSFIPAKKNNVNAKIAVNEFLFSSKIVKNIILNFAINNDYIDIRQFNAIFPDGLIINIADIKQVEIDGVQHLTGKFMFESKNIVKNIAWLGLEDYISFKTDSNVQFTSDLMFSELFLGFKNIKVNIDNQQVISGEYGINTGSDKKKDHRGDIQISNMNFDNIYFPKLLQNISVILKNSNNPTYLSDFKMIREVSAEINLNISVKNSVINSKNISNLDSNIVMKNNSIEVASLKIDSDFAKIDSGNLVLGAGSINPMLVIQLAGDFIDFSFFSSFENLQITHNTDDSLLSLFRFDIFEGYIYSSLKKVNCFGKLFNNIIIDTKMSDNKMFINNIQGNLNSNYFDIKGSYAFSQNIPTFSLGFASNIVDINDFLKNIFMIDKLSSGRVEMSGSVVTYGKYKKDLISNLQMNVNFKGEEILVNGFDIKKIINLSAKIDSPGDMSFADYVKYYLANGQTNINKISGNVNAASGSLQVNNVMFSSYYSNGALSLSMNLPSSSYNMIALWTFVPAAGVSPIDLKLQSSGTIEKNELFQFDTKNLLEYLQTIYK
jgi:hypothetical protein